MAPARRCRLLLGHPGVAHPRARAVESSTGRHRAGDRRQILDRLRDRDTVHRGSRRTCLARRSSCCLALSEQPHRRPRLLRQPRAHAQWRAPGHRHTGREPDRGARAARDRPTRIVPWRRRPVRASRGCQAHAGRGGRPDHAVDLGRRSQPRRRGTQDAAASAGRCRGARQRIPRAQRSAGRHGRRRDEDLHADDPPHQHKRHADSADRVQLVRSRQGCVCDHALPTDRHPRESLGTPRHRPHRRCHDRTRSGSAWGVVDRGGWRTRGERRAERRTAS